MTELKPRMTPGEVAVLTEYCTRARTYVEFGCGGSTLLAASTVKRAVLTVDSDPAWLEKVAGACAAAGTKLLPQTSFADIGPTKIWGYPADAATRLSWPAYHEQIWTNPAASKADLFMVDGRFRVACLMQVLLHANASAVILVHDYVTRPHYHVVEPFVRELRRVDELVAFKRGRRFDRAQAIALLERHRYDTQ